MDFIKGIKKFIENPILPRICGSSRNDGMEENFFNVLYQILKKNTEIKEVIPVHLKYLHEKLIESVDEALKFPDINKKFQNFITQNMPEPKDYLGTEFSIILYNWDDIKDIDDIDNIKDHDDIKPKCNYCVYINDSNTDLKINILSKECQEKLREKIHNRLASHLQYQENTTPPWTHGNDKKPVSHDLINYYAQIAYREFVKEKLSHNVEKKPRLR